MRHQWHAAVFVVDPRMRNSRAADPAHEFFFVTIHAVGMACS
jgi:hypothetical protein